MPGVFNISSKNSLGINFYLNDIITNISKTNIINIPFSPAIVFNLLFNIFLA